MFKPLVLGIWVVCISAFFLPDTSAWKELGERLFWALLFVHTAECLVFLPRLRRAKGSLAHHLFQTLVFGILHARNVEPDLTAAGR
jgi:uncharacterized protein YhhL (DUF1145 family)